MLQSKAYQRILVVILCLSCSLLGCTTKEYSTQPARYLYTYTPNNNAKTTTVELLDKDGKPVFHKTIHTRADISYTKYEDGILFLHGPGGLYKFTTTKRKLTKISDRDVSNVVQTSKGVLYTENGGFQKNEGYRSTFYRNEQKLFDLPYAVNSLQYAQGRIYTSNIPHRDGDEDYFYAVYDENGKCISKQKQAHMGVIRPTDTNMMYISDQGIRDIKTNAYTKFPIPLHTSYPYLHKSKDYIVMDYDTFGDSCRLIDEKNKKIVWEGSCEGVDDTGNGRYVIKQGDTYIVYDATTHQTNQIVIPSQGKAQEHVFLL